MLIRTNAWELRKLEDLGNIYTGSTPNTSIKENWSDNGNGHTWITPTDIRSYIMNTSSRTLSDVGWKNARKVPKNSVLVTCIASIGKNAVNIIPVAFNQQINAIIPVKNDPFFILYSMDSNTNRLLALAGKTATAIINKKTFEKFKLVVPRLVEQQKIGSFFKHLDELITLHQRNEKFSS